MNTENVEHDEALDALIADPDQVKKIIATFQNENLPVAERLFAVLKHTLPDSELRETIRDFSEGMHREFEGNTDIAADISDDLKAQIKEFLADKDILGDNAKEDERLIQGLALANFSEGSREILQEAARNLWQMHEDYQPSDAQSPLSNTFGSCHSGEAANDPDGAAPALKNGTTGEVQVPNPGG